MRFNIALVFVIATALIFSLLVITGIEALLQ